MIRELVVKISLYYKSDIYLTLLPPALTLALQIFI